MYNQTVYSGFYYPYYYRLPSTCAFCGMQFHTQEDPMQNIYNNMFANQPYLKPIPKDEIYIDNDYLLALKSANKYLYAWMIRDGESAYDLISESIKKQYKDRDDFIMQFAGLSNPHHEAFEIIGDKRISKERIRFKVWMYYHVTGQSIPPYKRPESDIYIELIKVDEGIWLVDKILQ